MILDELRQAERYFGLHPRFADAFRYLRSTSFEGMAAGRHEIDGERLFVVINKGKGRGREKSPLEAHRKYIDIQLTLSGTDEIGWKPTGHCQQVLVPYNVEKEMGLWEDAPVSWIAVPPGSFTIFFPDDAHAPMAATCDLLKAVMKIAIDQNP